MVVPQHVTDKFKQRMGEYTRTLDCVHCGLCIPHCPTYDLTLRESDSPRGRIYLMRQYAEGTYDLTPAVEKHLDQCIVCRGCETVCPAGIQMGEMMESFREELQKTSRPTLRTRLGHFLLRQVLPHRGRIKFLTHLLYLYQATGVKWLGEFIVQRLLRLKGLTYMQRLQPTVPSAAARRIETDSKRPEGYPAHGSARMRVGLFLGCITSEWFAPTHRATIEVLRKNGCDVVIPDAQTCCGALHRHAGLITDARELFRRNSEVFRETGVDVVVVNAAGCGAALKEPPHGGKEFSVPIRDICEFLDEVGIVSPQRQVEKRVVYDQPCHLLHGQRVGADAVERLLKSISGVQLLPLPSSEKCCGSGGVYNLLQPEMAEPLGAEKAELIRRTGAEIVVTGNPGCAMQIRAALGDSDIEVMHPIDLLAQAYPE